MLYLFITISVFLLTCLVITMKRASIQKETIAVLKDTIELDEDTIAILRETRDMLQQQLALQEEEFVAVLKELFGANPKNLDRIVNQAIAGHGKKTQMN